MSKITHPTLVASILNKTKFNQHERMISKGIFFYILFGLMVEDSHIILDLYQNKRRSIYFLFLNKITKYVLNGDEVEKYPIDCQPPFFSTSGSVGKEKIRKLIEVMYGDTVDTYNTRMDTRSDTFTKICLQFIRPTLTLHLYARYPNL